MQFDGLGWLDVAVEVDYLNKSMDREGYTPKFLILHSTAGGTSAQAIANYFAGSAEASAHIIIGTDGAIVQGIPLSLAAWANGPIDGTPADNLGFRTQSDGIHRDSWWDSNINPNYLTIAAIEHCKASDDNSDSLTPAQQDASFRVIKAICDTYNIPKRFADASGGITGHFSMSAINRQRCPGPYPWQELFNYLKGQAPVTTQPTANQLSSANASWDSVLKGTVAGPAPKGTGIYQAWLQALISGKFYGPPLTREYGSGDWNGGHIVCQEFAHARCEWVAGSANWYGPNGKI